MRNIALMICLLIRCTSFSQAETKLLKTGADLFFKEDYTGALKIFEKEAKKNSSYETKFWIASCHFKMKEFSIAKKEFLNIINSQYKGPELAMSIVNTGSCYRSLNKIDSALYFYDMATTLFPKLVSGYFNKGQLLYSLDKFEQAKEMYNQAIVIDSNDWINYMKRQEISFILLEYDGALKDLIKAKALNPELKIDFNMAYCFSMLERYFEADSIYQKIYDASDPMFLNNYGFNKHKLGQTELGIELIQSSLRLNAGNSYAYRNLGVIALDQGNYPKSCEHLEKAKKLNFFSSYGSEVNDLLQKYCR